MRHGWAVILAVVFVFTGCPTEMKKLRTGNEDKNDSVTSKENFNVSFSYREIGTDPTNRVVQIQGNHVLPTAKFEPICGAAGDNCTCYFYQSTTDTSPVEASVVSLSPLSNVLSCTMPSSVTASNYNFVRVLTTDLGKNSGLVNINTTLTANTVLGDLDKTNVRSVFPYTCTRSFIEMDGVSGTSVACAVTGNLGFLQADYEFYVYKGNPLDATELAGNTADHPNDPVLYPPYCNRSGDAQYTCGPIAASPTFGVMKDPVGFFQTSVFLTSKPESSTANTLFGYAALADSNGLCPPGLMAIRAFRADPPSITKNSLGTNPPSTFINMNGSLNSIVVRDASVTPANFQVFRNPNSVVCDIANNDCSVAQFAGISLAVSVAYSSQYPIICGLSPTVLSTL